MSQLKRIKIPGVQQAFALADTKKILPLWQKAQLERSVLEKITTAILETIKVMDLDSYVVIPEGQESDILLKVVIEQLCRDYSILVNGITMKTQLQIGSSLQTVLAPELKGRDVLMICESIEKNEQITRLIQSYRDREVKSISIIAIMAA